jgi:hypothetical protein
MNGIGETQIVIVLDEQPNWYVPGSRLSGRYCLRPSAGDALRAVELSLLWYTVGQGEEDMNVHHFQRQAFEESSGVELALIDNADRWYPFESVLPNTPLSYDGVIVKIRWCVRIRVFPVRGREIVVEQPFRLGNVPPAAMVVT